MRFVCITLAAIVAACSNTPPEDLEERIEWYAERINEALTTTEPDVYGWHECSYSISVAAEDVQLRSAERAYPNAVALVVAEAQLCVERYANAGADWGLAKLHATLGHADTARTLATKAVERRIAAPDGVEAGRQADMIVEEFHLDDALHERVIANLQDRLRWFRNKTGATVTITNHPAL